MNSRPFLPAMCVPALVIVGRHDFIQTVDMATAIANGIPGARLAIFERSGHFPWIEERARFHDVVRDFVTALAW
jgi:proline iminopeptidase